MDAGLLLGGEPGLLATDCVALEEDAATLRLLESCTDEAASGHVSHHHGAGSAQRPAMIAAIAASLLR